MRAAFNSLVFVHYKAMILEVDEKRERTVCANYIFSVIIDLNLKPFRKPVFTMMHNNVDNSAFLSEHVYSTMTSMESHNQDQ